MNRGYTPTRTALDYFDVMVVRDTRLASKSALEQATRLYHALRNGTGKLRVNKAFLACGFNPTTASRETRLRFERAIGLLGWERKRCRLDGKLRWAFVKGTPAEREVEFVVEHDPRLQSSHGETAAAANAEEIPSASDDPFVAVLHHALCNRTGKLRVTDAYLLCGIERKASQSEITRIGRALRDLGWERSRLRFGGVLQYVYVKGGFEQRFVELVLEYQPQTHSLRFEERRPNAGSRQA